MAQNNSAARRYTLPFRILHLWQWNGAVFSKKESNRIESNRIERKRNDDENHVNTTIFQIAFRDMNGCVFNVPICRFAHGKLSIASKNVGPLLGLSHDGWFSGVNLSQNERPWNVENTENASKCRVLFFSILPSKIGASESNGRKRETSTVQKTGVSRNNLVGVSLTLKIDE